MWNKKLFFACAGGLFLLSAVLTYTGINAYNASHQNGRPYSLIVLPDTQKYSEKTPEIFCAQIAWVLNPQTIKMYNPIFVSQLGDLVQNAGTIMFEWNAASQCMGMLDGKIPYGLIPGNHDVDVGDSPDSTSTVYNNYFPTKRYAQYDWYGGAYKDYQNNYQFVTIGPLNVLFLNLEVDPTDEDLNWANTIAKQYQDRQIIVTTHAYQYDDVAKRSVDPHFRTGGNSGEDIWNKFVKINCNIFMVLSAHFHNGGGENYLATKNQCGLTVHQIVQDYQGRLNGGNGLLRIYTFYPLSHQIQVQTYSPITNTFENDKNSSFVLSM
jgi:hypothetical protein